MMNSLIEKDREVHDNILDTRFLAAAAENAGRMHDQEGFLKAIPALLNASRRGRKREIAEVEDDA